MNGKVFRESRDMYDDIAQVLFSYFEKAARRIVAEEQAIEGRIREKESALATLETSHSAMLKQSRTGIVISVAAGLVLGIAGALIFNELVVTIVAILAGATVAVVFYYLMVSKTKTAEATRAELGQNILVLQEEHRAIRREYRVSDIRYGFVPIAQRIPFGKQSILVDRTGTLPLREFTLSELRMPEESAGSAKELHTLTQSIPLVESAEEAEPIQTGQYSESCDEVPLMDWTGKLDRSIRNLSYYLSQKRDTTVAMRIIEPGTPESGFIETFCDDRPATGSAAGLFPAADLEEAAATFTRIAGMTTSSGMHDEFDVFLENLVRRVGEVGDLYASLRASGSESLNALATRMLLPTLKASFNYYLPQAEEESIERLRTSDFDYNELGSAYEPVHFRESSRLRYDLVSDNWVAEDGSRTSFPFAVHQIFEEVISPIVANLMASTRIERLKIYNAIKDQKLSYINQWHQDTEDFYGRNRTEMNQLLGKIRTLYAELQADIGTFKALSGTLEAMPVKESAADGDTGIAMDQATMASFAGMTALYQKATQDFQELMDRIKDEIEELSKEFAHIEFYDASLREGELKKIVRAMESGTEDPRREALMEAGPYIALHAQLPPEGHLDESAAADAGIDLVTALRKALGGTGSEV